MQISDDATDGQDQHSTLESIEEAVKLGVRRSNQEGP